MSRVKGLPQGAGDKEKTCTRFGPRLCENISALFTAKIK
jgi:hypothetical protein